MNRENDSSDPGEVRWVRIATCESIPAREGRPVVLAGRELAVFNLGDGRFLATDNSCPHRGGPLCDGIVAGESVVCPLHAWKVNLGTGRIERPEGGTHAHVRTYPARVEGGIVAIGLPADMTGFASVAHATKVASEEHVA